MPFVIYSVFFSLSHIFFPVAFFFTNLWRFQHHRLVYVRFRLIFFTFIFSIIIFNVFNVFIFTAGMESSFQRQSSDISVSHSFIYNTRVSSVKYQSLRNISKTFIPPWKKTLHMDMQSHAASRPPGAHQRTCAFGLIWRRPYWLHAIKQEGRAEDQYEISGRDHRSPPLAIPV